MKKIASYVLMINAIAIIGCSCPEEPMPGNVINTEQVSRLWELAISKEMVGEPQHTAVESLDSITNRKVTLSITTQHFKIVVGTDEKGNPLPAKDSAIARLRVGVLGSTSCTGVCIANGPNISCNVSGCSVDGSNCTALSCGTGCTMQLSCTKSSSARIWGTIIL